MSDLPTPAVQNVGRSLATDQSGTSWLASSWWEQLQPGSWRGVGFIMDTAATRAGRRTALHEYPYRDTVWVEDLGKAPRRFTFQAFLTGDDVYQQRDKMIAACETAGPGTLVHPTLGTLECVLLDFAVTDRREIGRVVEITLNFILSSSALSPSGTSSTGDAVSTAADAADTASAGDLSSSLSAIGVVVAPATAFVSKFSALAVDAVNDPVRALSAVTGLIGYYGRYAAGSRQTLQPTTATVSSVLSDSITTRQAVLDAGTALNTAARAA
jgi:prophage DNA circulation protein